MADDLDRQRTQEQLERRRLSRLVDALPVFSGFATPDGHLTQSRPETTEAFLWALPAFSYDHDSVTQIVDLCEKASDGERIQVERTYRKEAQSSADTFARGLLTLTPIEDDAGHISEIAVTLIDCEENGLAPPDQMAKTRLANANARIEAMLSLAQTVIETTKADEWKRSTRSSTDYANTRSRLSVRLDALASVIDIISEPSIMDMPLRQLLDLSLKSLSPEQRTERFKTEGVEGLIPIAATPIIALLLAELIDNARLYGALREDESDRSRGRITFQSEVRDARQGRTLRIHWIEDGGPSVPAVLDRGFGMTLAEKLFPQVTGGTTNLLNSEEGLSWTFALPVSDGPDDDIDEYEMGYIP